MRGPAIFGSYWSAIINQHSLRSNRRSRIGLHAADCGYYQTKGSESNPWRIEREIEGPDYFPFLCIPVCECVSLRACAVVTSRTSLGAIGHPRATRRKPPNEWGSRTGLVPASTSPGLVLYGVCMCVCVGEGNRTDLVLGRSSCSPLVFSGFLLTLPTLEEKKVARLRDHRDSREREGEQTSYPNCVHSFFSINSDSPSPSLSPLLSHIAGFHF